MKIIIVASGLVIILLMASIATAITSTTISNNDSDNDFLEYDSIPQFNKMDRIDSYESWNPEDDGDHSPCGYECWCYQAVITLDNGERWDAAATFVYFMNKTRNGFTEGISFIRIRHWNRETGGKVYDSFRTDIYPGPFQTSKNEMNLEYGNSYAQGTYPNYNFHCEDNENNIITDLQLYATSYPFWGFKDVTDGVVPWGFSGTGKGYFIPTLDIEGTVTIDGVVHNASGIAYIEHDFFWNNFANPLASYSVQESLTCNRLLSTTIKWYAGEVLRNRPRQGSRFFHFDNGNMFGWSWSWVLFDNGWSIVLLRPVLLGLSEGLAPMLLYLSKDGKNYNEIGCGYWTNNQLKYMKRVDIYIPFAYSISAYKDDVELHLDFTPATEMTELYSEDWAPSAKAKTCTFYCCGDVTGTYVDEDGTVELNGSYTTEQSRWLSKGLERKGYRSFEIKFIRPPEGRGIIIKRVSHKLGIETYLKIQLKPKFEFKSYIKFI